MAHFYLTANNSRDSTVTAAGAKSGQFAHLRGWHAGVVVTAYVEDGKDCFTITMTGGSTGCGWPRLIGTVIEGDDGPTFLPGPFIKDGEEVEICTPSKT